MRRVLVVTACLVLTACGESAPPKQSAGASAPVRMACTTPQQAGLKAQDVTRKLVEARKQGAITPEQYVAYNNTFSQGLSAWAETQNLPAYCATLDRIVKDAGLQ
jgi:hypothetical protein